MSKTRESVLEQQMGPRQYREMIHRGSKEADQKNLPFTFPKKSLIKGGKTVWYICDSCGKSLAGSKKTYIIICSSCKKLIYVGREN